MNLPNSMVELNGQLVLLSGGLGAIGRALVDGFVAHGARVAVNDILPIDDAPGHWIGSDGSARYFPADVSDEQSVVTLFDEVVTSFGHLPTTVLCHAGLVGVHPLQEYPMEEFDALFALNVRSSFLLGREASRRWLEKASPGHLIFTSSWCQDVPWPAIGPYNASKAAVRQLARSFARELAPHGIRANVIAPGIVDAGMARREWDTNPDYQARAARAIPLGYLQPLESVVNAFIFIASPLASYATGTTLVVDGGASLYPMDE